MTTPTPADLLAQLRATRAADQQPNAPRCPVCVTALDVWATGASVRASCPDCGWTWAT